MRKQLVLLLCALVLLSGCVPVRALVQSAMAVQAADSPLPTPTLRPTATALPTPTSTWTPLPTQPPAASTPSSPVLASLDTLHDSPLPTPAAPPSPAFLTPTVTPVSPRLLQAAVDYLVAQTGASPGSLVLENQHPRSYRELGREFIAFNFFNTRTSESFILLVDLKTEEVAELADMEAANAQAHVAKYGKLDPALYERLQTVDDVTELQVGVWATTSNWDELYPRLVFLLALAHPEVAAAVARGNMPFDVGDPVLSKQLRKEWNVLLQRETDAALAPLVAALEADGIEFEKPGSSPSLVAHLTKAQIETLAKRPDVQALFLLGGETEPALGPTPTPASGTELPFDVVMQNSLTSYTGTKPAVYLITPGSDAQPVLINLGIDLPVNGGLPEEFMPWVQQLQPGQVLLALFRERQASGGYDIKTNRVVLTGKELHVYVELCVPGSGDAVAAAESAYFQAVRVTLPPDVATTAASPKPVLIAYPVDC